MVPEFEKIHLADLWRKVFLQSIGVRHISRQQDLRFSQRHQSDNRVVVSAFQARVFVAVQIVEPQCHGSELKRHVRYFFNKMKPPRLGNIRDALTDFVNAPALQLVIQYAAFIQWPQINDVGMDGRVCQYARKASRVVIMVVDRCLGRPC